MKEKTLHTAVLDKESMLTWCEIIISVDPKVFDPVICLRFLFSTHHSAKKY